MTSSTAPLSPPAEVRDDRMPRGIWYIVSNEFAERFCFYGINAILTTYFTQHLHFTEVRATSWQSMFKAGAYFFPLLGAIVSDVFWGKTRTILSFSLLYAAGCIALAAVGQTEAALAASLFLIAFGTGGIKPCVSTNVGDQFTARNQHLLPRAFSWFYLAINAGSFISIFLCPVLLKDERFGPTWAFGLPAAMMLAATLVFWLGRGRFAAVPPAGRAWLADIFSKDGLKLIANLAIIYVFAGFFWMLWDQSNGNTWTLQATSSLMDKDLGLGITLLPAQLQSVNGLFILALTPVFTYVVYPAFGRFTAVTPLRRIGVGIFTAAAAFLLIAFVEGRILHGQRVSAWWQILAYGVLTCAEILVSITALEFSYKQAPLRMKSFVMALYYWSISLGNTMFATVNYLIERPVRVEQVAVGEETWVELAESTPFVVGQKVDFTGESGIEVLEPDGAAYPLAGTYLVQAVDGPRLKLMDVVDRRPLASRGAFKPSAQVTTYRLVGPDYFYLFIALAAAAGVLFIFVARAYQERSYVRADEAAAGG